MGLIMGCDIHAIFQAKRNGVWEDISSDYNQDRHYQLFAVLAGVRNGTGFAGSLYGDQVTPISNPRGLPADFPVQDNCHVVVSVECLRPWKQWWIREHPPEDQEDLLNVWMGDHSFSWLTADEMLAYHNETVTHYGVITRDQYEVWDRTEPTTYSGGIVGKGVLTVTEAEYHAQNGPEGCTHVQVSWLSDLNDELGYFFDEIRRLKELHGEVRMVFGFDS